MLKNHFLHRFLNAESIAVVGATRNPFSVNFHLINNLKNLGYKGKIFPVNPKADDVLGIKAYKTVSEINQDIDLVVISVPAHNVLDVVRDLVGVKIGGVALVTGGFSEIGEEGRRMQDEISGILKANGIRAIGPNALSPVNSHNSLAVSFFPLHKLPIGKVSFIFQSGMYEPRFNWILSDFHLGISKLLDLGNKMDVTEVDALEYLSADPQTEAICIHLEAIKGDGRKFFKLLKETTRTKPVVVLKGGRTEAGAKAAMSHTGSLVRGSDAVFDAAIRQAGAIRTETLDEFLYLAKAFSYLPPLPGNRIAIATFPGGEAVLTTDLCLQNGFELAKLGSASYEKLKSSFPPWNITLNPYDFGIIYTFHGVNNNHELFIETMLEDQNVDCIALQLPPLIFPLDPPKFCPAFIRAIRQGKPLAVWPPHMLRLDGDLVTYLENHSVPVFPSAAITIRCLGALNRYRLYLQAL
ncbi:MAG: CoA-binding protein [Chloroflexi bacterium]|nr:CoA-binding protein [Chloroflexota bacterium]